MSRSLEEKFWILRKGPQFSHGYNTRKQAIEDGAVIMAYGYFLVNHFTRWFNEPPNLSAFLDQLVNFIGIGLTLYFLANVYGYFAKGSIIKFTIKCPYCRKDISKKVLYFFFCISQIVYVALQAKRCPLCTTWQDGREDRETTAIPAQDWEMEVLQTSLSL